MDIDDESIVIEEVDGANINEAELLEFVPVATIPATRPAKIPKMVPVPSTSASSTGPSSSQASARRAAPVQIDQEHESNLIKKLINGEMSFSEYKKEIGEDDVVIDDDEQDDEHVSVIATPVPASATTTSSLKSNVTAADTKPAMFEEELFQSRKDAMRGILKGRDQLRDGRQRRRCVLPVALQGLMGEANLCYARGQNELAEKVCLEIIRQVPLAHEPFLTLAQIHEANPEKYMQFSLIAAHLNPADSEQWMRIAQFCIEQDNIKQAINCYTKAIKFNPKDINLRTKRIQLLESINEDKIAFRCWCSLVFVIPSEQGEFLLDTAKRVAERCIKDANYAKALEAMGCAYSKVPELFRNEDLNQLLELLIGNHQYKKVVDILVLHAGLDVSYIKMEGTDGTADDSIILKCIIPNSMNLDFRTKLIVCLVHLRAFHLLDYLFKNIFTYIRVEEAGDCYLDIAEALMKEEKFEEALTLLVPLVESKNYSLAAVWLRHADCYRAIGKFDQAIESYSQVVSLAPQHFDARLTLAALLKQQGREAEALRALEQDLECDLIDPCVLYERCFMLKETGNLDQYINVAQLLISRHCIRVRTRYEMLVVAHLSKHSNKVQLIKESRRNRKEPLEDLDGPEFVASAENEPSWTEEYSLFKDVLATAFQTGHFGAMQRLAITSLSSRRFVSHHQKEMYFFALLSTIFNRDANFAYVLAREYVVKHLNNHRVWNLFNVVLQFTEDNRYSRFLMRLFLRVDCEVDEWPRILRANYYITSGTYKYALNDYMRIFKKTNSPLVALLIGITYISIGQQKFTTKKHTVIAQAISFLNTYEKIREPEAKHEIHYNLGRLHHQFGMIHIAIYHYKEVLSYTNELIEKHEDFLDLKREAAYNLHLIYKKAGNFNLARKYLYDYIII